MTQPLSLEAVQDVLARFIDPETGRDVLTMEQVHHIQIDGGKLSCDFGLTTHSAPIWQRIQTEFEQHLRDHLPGLTELSVNHLVHQRPAPPVGEFGLTVKSVIAVGSGKGGVGKSTIAASLALGLNAAGSKVGIMDADVYGPSIPQLLGLNDAGNPTVNENKKIVPVDAGGIPVLSMGFMIPEGDSNTDEKCKIVIAKIAESGCANVCAEGKTNWLLARRRHLMWTTYENAWR